MIELDPDEGRIVVGMTHGEFSAAIVVRRCAFYGVARPVTIHVNPKYLVEALTGMVEIDGEAQIEILPSATDADVSPLYLRLVPNVVTSGMVAFVMPMRGDGDGEAGMQEALTAVMGSPSPRGPEAMPLPFDGADEV